VLVNPVPLFPATHAHFFVCGASLLVCRRFLLQLRPSLRFTMAAAAALPKEMRAIVIDAKGGQ
jgi:hypothetical protein